MSRSRGRRRRPGPPGREHQIGAGLIAFATGALRDVTGSYDVAWYLSGALCGAAALMALVIRRRPEEVAAVSTVG